MKRMRNIARPFSLLGFVAVVLLAGQPSLMKLIADDCSLTVIAQSSPYCTEGYTRGPAPSALEAHFHQCGISMPDKCDPCQCSETTVTGATCGEGELKAPCSVCIFNGSTDIDVGGCWYGEPGAPNCPNCGTPNLLSCGYAYGDPPTGWACIATYEVTRNDDPWDPDNNGGSTFDFAYPGVYVITPTAHDHQPGLDPQEYEPDSDLWDSPAEGSPITLNVEKPDLNVKFKKKNSIAMCETEKGRLCGRQPVGAAFTPVWHTPNKDIIDVDPGNGTITPKKPGKAEVVARWYFAPHFPTQFSEWSSQFVVEGDDDGGGCCGGGTKERPRPGSGTCGLGSIDARFYV